jgi:hypothetical protein
MSPLIPIATAAFFFCAFGCPRRHKLHPWFFIAGLGLVLGLTAPSGCGAYQGSITPAPVTSTVTVN